MNRTRFFYLDAARIAISSIRAHKLRAFLTLIGIIIGVASVVVVGAAISGLNTYVIDRVSAVLGANHFMIAKGAMQGNIDEEQWERLQRVHRRLELNDFAWVAAHCKSCLEVGAQLDRRIDVKENGQEILGVRTHRRDGEHGTH